MNPERLRRDDTLGFCDIFRPLEVGNACGLNLKLLNFPGFVTFKERQIEKLRTITVSVGADTFAKAGADDGIIAERGKKLRSHQQRASNRLAFAAAGDF